MRSTSKASLPSRICPAKGRDCASKQGIAARQPGDHALERRPGRGFGQGGYGQPFGGQRILGNIDPVQVAVILGAILQMIDDLQRGAQRIIGGPGVPAFAMHIQHEAAHRHRRIAAIIDQIVPIAIAQLGDVAAEGFQQIQRMLIASAHAPPAPRASATAFGRGRRFRPPGWRASLPAAAAFPPARRWRGRRYRRRSARSDKRPAPAGDGAARSEKTRRENSRPCGPCRIEARPLRSCLSLRPGRGPSTCRLCPTNAGWRNPG